MSLLIIASGGWFPWGTEKPGNNPEDFVPAYRRIVDKLRATKGGAGFKFQIGYNVGGEKGTNLKEFYVSAVQYLSCSP
jgi:beta-mannanase